jgi:cytochrome c
MNFAMHTLPSSYKAFTQKAVLLLVVTCFIAACNPKQEEIENREKSFNTSVTSNAFRSTLDGKARILTLKLDNDINVAYDTDSATLYKIWQGNLTLEGAVFNGRHGPQPSSEGVSYMQNTQEQWVNDNNIGVEYKAYQYYPDTNQSVLFYQASNGEWQAEVQEKISAERDKEELVITRSFEVSGLPAGISLGLKNTDIDTNSVISGDASLSEARSMLLNNGSSTLVTRHSEVIQMLSLNKVEEVPAGLALIQNSDCVACHNKDKKTVGPAYIDIATRYANTPNAVQMLSQKVIDGGSGNWGQVAMNAHPDLMLQDANEMIKYILSLAANDSANSSQSAGADLFAGEKAVPLSVSQSPILHDADKAGAYVYLSRLPRGEEPTLEGILASVPEYGGHAEKIHLPNSSAYGAFAEMISLKIKTNLVLTEALNTTLRLVSDDGSYLYLNGDQLIDNWGFHGDVAVDAQIDLPAGTYPIEIIYMQGLGGASLSLQWFNPSTNAFEVIPPSMLKVTEDDVMDVVKKDPSAKRNIPGDKSEVSGVHPAFNLHQARPDDFEPMVGGIAFMPNGDMVVSTWDSEGSVYIISNYSASPDNISVKRIAKGLAEPLGIQVVDGNIYVLQKQELTKLVDTNNDGLIDRYEALAKDWTVSDNFHEFAFGLEYAEGYFYAALATAINPGGASTQPQAPDRGKVLKINKDTGDVEFIAHGLRTPNGIGFGIDGGLFIADNQGDWLPSSKIVEVTPNAFYGSRSVDFEGTAGLQETLPVVWLPQDEIGNSPSQPAPLNIGPYQNQMIHGEVTHGGLKRVFAERIDGRLQGAVFRFSQGFEAGVNRIAWSDETNLIVGGVGNPGNWAHSGKEWYGLQRMEYNGNSVFEMLSVSARSDGFEITFTEAIANGQNISSEDFEILQWYYKPSAEYGGPKLDLRPLEVKAFSLSDDRTKAQFKLPGIKPNHVVYFRIKQPFVSENDNELWTSEAWYTLNAIPKNKPVVINPNFTVSHNALTKQEMADGWELLFDGQSLDNFRNYNQETLGKKWIIDDHALHLTGRDKNQDGWQTEDGGDVVITSEPLENYELYLEWKISSNGNSGIIYNVKESDDLDFPFLSGPEYQILDNLGHPDGRILTHRAGDNYDLIESKIVAVNPPNTWNRARLIVNNGKVEHWLNGYKVVDTEMFTPQWNELIQNSKFADWQDFAKSPGGHIVLQDHGDKVWFRNIKIRAVD